MSLGWEEIHKPGAKQTDPPLLSACFSSLASNTVHYTCNAIVRNTVLALRDAGSVQSENIEFDR